MFEAGKSRGCDSDAFNAGLWDLKGRGVRLKWDTYVYQKKKKNMSSHSNVPVEFGSLVDCGCSVPSTRGTCKIILFLFLLWQQQTWKNGHCLVHLFITNFLKNFPTVSTPADVTRTSRQLSVFPQGTPEQLASHNRASAAVGFSFFCLF